MQGSFVSLICVQRTVSHQQAPEGARITRSCSAFSEGRFKYLRLSYLNSTQNIIELGDWVVYSEVRYLLYLFV